MSLILKRNFKVKLIIIYEEFVKLGYNVEISDRDLHRELYSHGIEREDLPLDELLLSPPEEPDRDDLGSLLGPSLLGLSPTKNNYAYNFSK